MEIIYGTAKTQFINGRVGTIDRGQRFTCKPSLMREFEEMGLVDIEDDRYKSITPIKKKNGSRFVIVASGVSLNNKDVKYIKDAKKKNKIKVIVVNDNYKKVPNADILYACDFRWWKYHYPAVKKSFTGELWTQCPETKTAYPEINRILGKHEVGLPKEDNVIHFGGNGGYQAICLAYQMGASEIFLVGFDMQKAGKKTHWFGEHPHGLNVPSPFKDWLPKYDILAQEAEKEGLKIINCSRKTALKCFPRGELCKMF